MAEESAQPSGSGTPKAPKDKSCPYCHQAFTSSSLGRHLDLYIKERNPKAPDGVHDIEEIRRVRGGVTRRQPKGPSRRNTSASIGTPAATSRKSPVSEDGSSMVKSPLSMRDGAQLLPESAGRKFPFNTPWEATGVINDIPTKDGETARRTEGGVAEGSRPASQRAASRQMHKQQVDARHRIRDALDTSRAAELLVRELIGSFRAAKSVSRSPVLGDV